LRVELALTEKARRLLWEVVTKRKPELVEYPILEPDWLPNPDQLAQLELTVVEELTATGLGKDDEPNERGFLLEALINELNSNRF